LRSDRRRSAPAPSAPWQSGVWRSGVRSSGGSGSRTLRCSGCVSMSSRSTTSTDLPCKPEATSPPSRAGAPQHTANLSGQRQLRRVVDVWRVVQVPFWQVRSAAESGQSPDVLSGAGWWTATRTTTACAGSGSAIGWPPSDAMGPCRLLERLRPSGLLVAAMRETSTVSRARGSLKHLEIRCNGHSLRFRFFGGAGMASVGPRRGRQAPPGTGIAERLGVRDRGDAVAGRPPGGRRAARASTANAESAAPTGTPARGRCAMPVGSHPSPVEAAGRRPRGRAGPA
jgi:hypothetical protein